MKTILIYSVTIIMALFFVQSTVFAQKNGNTKVVKLQTSAHTKMCKAKIEKTYAYEKGIVKAELDRESQILTVTYKPKKTNIKKIIKVINGLGHEAMEITKKKDTGKADKQGNK